MRVMTYNIRGGLGMDGQRSIERIASVIRESDPDVVCLQEIHQRTIYGTWRDQPHQLQKLLAMPVIFQRNLNLVFGGEGIAVAARLPIISVQRHFLHSVRERRGVLEVKLQGTNRPLTIFCTHWGLKPEERGVQAEQTAEWINHAKTSAILCGDLNDVPNSQCLEILRTMTVLHTQGDAKAPTYPASAPKLKIDYVLCSPDLEIRRIFPIVSLASDHCPVVAEIIGV